MGLPYDGRGIFEFSKDWIMKGIIFTESNFHLTVQGIKKQTRRIMKPQPDYFRLVGTSTINSINTPFGTHGIITPRYKVGEILYLKEPYQDCPNYHLREECPALDPFNTGFIYKYSASEQVKEEWPEWKNKLFMPKSAARYFIKITDVRCERLQDISKSDCIKEGITYEMAYECNGWRPTYNDPDSGGYPDYEAAYADLIGNINGKGTWESNPYVWVYCYKLMAELSEK